MKTLLAILFAPMALFAQPSFPTNVVVLPQTNGSVTVQWTPSASTNINHVVYIGVAPGTYNVSLTVSNGSTANIPNLAPGFTYYFSVRAKDRTSGVESDASNEANYQVRKPAAPSQLQTTMITPVLEWALFPEGPWISSFEWPTKTLPTDGDGGRRFYRVKLVTEHGPLITKL